MTSALVSLGQLAKEINSRFELAEKYRAKAEDHRIAAGIALTQARELVLSEDQSKGAWGRWLVENVRRSRSDCYAVMKIVASPDPVAARNYEKVRAREGMNVTRATVCNVTDRPDYQFEEAVNWYVSQAARVQDRFLWCIGARRT